MESPFSKVTETSVFCKSVEKSNICMVSSFLEISRSPFLTGVAGLQYTVCNAIKNEVLTKFIKCALKLTENFRELISNGVPY